MGTDDTENKGNEENATNADNYCTSSTDTDAGVEKGEVMNRKRPLISGQTMEEGYKWTTTTQLHDFLRWCDEVGITVSPKVCVQREGACHRYGMITMDVVETGEVLCTIPRTSMLNPDNSRIADDIVDYVDWLDSIGQTLDDSSGWSTLLITLMVEFNDKDSFWAPYLRLVPELDEFGHPMFWKMEEMNEELKGTTLLNDVQRDIYNIDSEYKQFVLPFVYRYKNVCGKVEQYDVNLYRRLFAFVMSNSVTNSADSPPSLIPMADLLNYSANSNARLVFEENCVKVVASRKIERNQEVYRSVGRLGNAELLQMYGYTDSEPNVFDSLPILVNTFLDAMESAGKVSDPFFHAKVALLNKTEIASSDDYFLFDRNGMRRGPDLVQMLKILFMVEGEFEDLLKSRCSNRPDSWYQKLMRKLNLAKRTDVSSGVAIIDITEEDQDQDQDSASRKRSGEHGSSEEPPTKRLNTGTHVVSNQKSDAVIVIDESDNDDDGVKSLDATSIDHGESQPQDEKPVQEEIGSSSVDEKAIDVVSEKIGENETAEKTSSEQTDKPSDVNTAEKTVEESSKDEEKVLSVAMENIQKDSSVPVLGEEGKSVSCDENDNPVGVAKKEIIEDDSESDDIEFVSEDIRCKMSYGKLEKELKPEWKAFVKSVLNMLMKSIKQDDGMTLEEARQKYNDRQFYAYQVRRSQRTIVRTFLLALTTPS